MKMKNYLNLGKAALILGISFSLTQTACRKEEDPTSDMSTTTPTSESEKYSPGNYDAAVVQPWYSLLDKLIIESPGHTPPIAAREIGYAGIALYESTTGGAAGGAGVAR